MNTKHYWKHNQIRACKETQPYKTKEKAGIFWTSSRHFIISVLFDVLLDLSACRRAVYLLYSRGHDQPNNQTKLGCRNEDEVKVPTSIQSDYQRPSVLNTWENESTTHIPLFNGMLKFYSHSYFESDRCYYSTNLFTRTNLHDNGPKQKLGIKLASKPVHGRQMLRHRTVWKATRQSRTSEPAGCRIKTSPLYSQFCLPG